MRREGLEADVRTLFTAPSLIGLAAAVSRGTGVEVPANLIPEGCCAITPAMLPLIELSQAEIDGIAACVPGGCANIQDIYPLAPLQEGVLFHHLLGGEGDVYLTPALLAFDGRARLEGFLAALRAVIGRHDILRTAVLWEGLSQPVQVVWRDAPLVVDEVELDPAGGDAAARLRARSDPRHTRLDVRQAPLIRAFVAHDRTQERWLLLLLHHHLVMDHTTLAVLVGEVQASLSGEAARLPAPVPFRNFVAQARLGVSLEEHEAFFRGMLGDVEEPSAPFGLLDVQGDGSEIEEARVALPAELAGRLRKRARALGVSAASLFHLAWGLVVARASGRAEAVSGTVLFGRMQGGADVDRAVGMFINTLPIRLPAGDEGAEAAVRRVHGLLAELLRHEHAPLALAQRCSGVPAPAPLFTALLNYRHSGGGGAEAGAAAAWEGVRALGGEERTNYPLAFDVDDFGEAFALTAQTPPEVGAARVCAFMLTALEGLAAALEQAPDTPLRSIGVLPEAERHRAVVEWNATDADYPSDKCIHELFEAQAEKAPDAVAVVYEGRQLTYGELNAQANRLAHHLRGLGVKPDTLVAICVERSLEMVAGLLAILKAGGAYVPLDPAYPAERLAFMLADSAPAAVLTDAASRAAVADCAGGLPAVDLAADAHLWAGQPAGNPDRAGLTPGHLAYVIYTSGSTGRPKGVVIEHRNTVNFISWARSAFSKASLECTLFSTSLNFDLSVYECFVPLACGAQVKLAANTLELLKTDAGVTLLNTVPSAMWALVNAGRVPETVRIVNLAGEPLKRALIEQIFAASQAEAVCNLYGPSETTTYSTWTAMTRQDGFSTGIGRPISNTRIYILDGHGEPVPIGVAGELYIGGAGVARGYLNRPELTAERFVADPFAGEPGARMYKTGDLGRWLADGNIEFLGRTDFQVKMRGFRIELGEIEARLSEHAGVREAVVVAREDSPGDKRLAAYWTGNEELSAEGLRAHLAASLPDYMVPAAYMRLDALPLTPNGKLDRKALPAPEGAAFASRGYEAPRGEAEETLARLWAELLKVERVGRHDNFFELGGHSLLAVKLISRLRRALGIEIPLAALFAHPVLADFAASLAQAPADLLPPVVAGERGDGPLPLSFAQQRLWFLGQLGEAGSAYHIPGGLRLKGRLDREALVRALDRIVARHEGLRTTFGAIDGQPVQRIAPADVGFALTGHDLRGVVDIEAELKRLAAAEAAAPFDLERGPLIRGRLVRLGEEDHALLATMHHIVSDGWSMGVLTGELSALYAAFSQGREDPLPPLAVQYADYALWQRRWLEGEVLKRQAAYWQEALAGAPALLTLPLDRPRPAEQSFAGASVEVRLGAELTRALKALSLRHGVTLHMTLLAGFAALLGRLSGQEEVVIGSPAANRGRAEIEGLIGFFVNTLALRMDLSGAPTVAELLARARAVSLGAQSNQDLPFEQVVELVQPPRSLSHPAVFQAMFAWQNAPGGALALPGLALSPVASGHAAAKFDLSLSLGEAGDGIAGSLIYAPALFEAETVERWLGSWVRLLAGMAADDAQAVGRIALLSAAERHRAVVEWNATDADYPSDKCIHELFEAQAEKAPDAVAVVYEGRQLTYGELNAQANRLAHHLRGLGVKPDTLVAICVERSLEMVAGLLAILKAGGAYVPLDPAYPAERLAFMLADSAPAAVLTDAASRAAVADCAGGLPAIDLAADAHLWAGQPESNPDRAGLTPGHLAYVIYTSGSTGRPKGVMVEHCGLINHLSCAVRLPINFSASEDSVLQRTLIPFDASVWESLDAAAIGARLSAWRRSGGDEGAGRNLSRLLRNQEKSRACSSCPVNATGALTADAEKASACRCRLEMYVWRRGAASPRWRGMSQMIAAGKAECQPLRSDRSDSRRYGVGTMAPEPGAASNSHRPSDLEHADLHFGRSWGAGSHRGRGGALHRRRGGSAGVFEPPGADGGAVCGRSVCGRAWRADVQDGRSGAVACGRQYRVSGPHRLPGEDARLPHRAWRDRGAA